LVIRADCRYMNTGAGLHRFIHPVDNGASPYSQSETADATRMSAGFDPPDLKATYQLTVTAPDSWKVTSDAPAAEITDAANGTRRHVFATTEPMSTYLVALVAGPYAEWRDEFPGEDGQDPIPLGI